jgi:phosphoribosyl 1,2-cyclic phosphodiesterase
MTTPIQPRSSNTALIPVRNMRITFWGVRGTCPVFPAPHEVEEYTRQTACYTIMRAAEDCARKAAQSGGRISVEDVLEGPLTAANVAAYQRKLGLPDLPVYGGETTCIEVETRDGHVIILDAGSGVRHCALRIVKNWANRRDRTVSMFFSHEHLDHRSGLPFSRFCFVNPDPYTLNIYGSYQFLYALDRRLGVFSRTFEPSTYFDDPLDFSMMSATFRGTELRDATNLKGVDTDRAVPWQIGDISKPIQIGSTVVTAFPVYHGNCRCLAYKIENGDSKFVFCTDHELRHGTNPDDPRQKLSLAAEKLLRSHCMDADVAYFDGQYYLAEYKGERGIGSSMPVPRMDWGHSCIEDVLSRTEECRIKHTFVGHHDPDREWAEQIKQDEGLAAYSAKSGHKVELAKGDSIIDL